MQLRAESVTASADICATQEMLIQLLRYGSDTDVGHECGYKFKSIRQHLEPIKDGDIAFDRLG